MIDKLYEKSQYIAKQMGYNKPTSEHVLLALLRGDSKGFGPNIIRRFGLYNNITYANLKPCVEKYMIYDSGQATNDTFILILEESKYTDDCDYILMKLMCELLSHPNSSLKNTLNHITNGYVFMETIRRGDDTDVPASNELFIDRGRLFNVNNIGFSIPDIDSSISYVDNTNTLYDEPEYNELSNFNKKMKNNKYEIVGMDNELNELIKGLMRLKKPNVIITGEAGVGKTALVEKLALSINNGKVPDFLKNKRIFELSISSVEAGTQYRGSFEEKLNNILDYVKKDGNIILFIDEIHMMVNAGTCRDNDCGMGDILKPALSRGEIQVIGATTQKEFNKFIKGDSALTRRFKVINMDEPNLDNVVDIIYGSKDIYEKHYNTTVTKDEIVSICEKAKNRTGNFPDKAFDELEDYLINKTWDRGGKQ